MTIFDKREEGFEQKFAHEEALRFRAVARRNKLLGLWAAQQLGMSADQAQAYANEVVAADFVPGDGAVGKVIRDLADNGVITPEAELRVKLDELMAQAIAQVKAGK
jgi:hypothetical protein